MRRTACHKTFCPQPRGFWRAATFRTVLGNKFYAKGRHGEKYIKLVAQNRVIRAAGRVAAAEWGVRARAARPSRRAG